MAAVVVKNTKLYVILAMFSTISDENINGLWNDAKTCNMTLETNAILHFIWKFTIIYRFTKGNVTVQSSESQDMWKAR